MGTLAGTNMIPADFGTTALGGVFHQVGQFVSDQVATVKQAFTPAAFRAQAAMQTPAEMIKTLVDSNPAKLSQLGALATADENFANALHEAVINDPTLAKGIVEASNSATGGELLEQLGDALQNPEIRADITLGLQNMAHQDDITFENLTQLADAVTKYDPLDMQASDKRVIDAYAGLGLPEEDALRAIRDGKMESAKEFLHDLFNNPEKAFGQLGNLIEKMGLPPELGEFLAGVLPQIQGLLAAAPGMMGQLFEPHVAFANEHIKPWAQETMVEGRQNMAQAGIQTPGLT